MASISSYNYIITTVKGKRFEWGSLSVPASIAAAGDDTYCHQFTVGTSSTLTLWDANATQVNQLADFDLLLLACDLPLYIEFQSAATIRYNVLRLSGTGTANSFGVPLILGADDTLTGTGDMATDIANTGVLEKIRVHNADASNTAEVLIMLFT